MDSVSAAGFDHGVTRLPRDHEVPEVLERAASGELASVSIDAKGTTGAKGSADGRRLVVVFSPERKARDDERREQLLARAEDSLVALSV